VNGKTIAHFAAFPPELPKRAILASCPPYICPTCAAPWVRLVKRQASKFNVRVRDNKAGRATAEEGYKATAEEIANYSGGDSATDLTPVETLGWAPTCTCPHPEKEFCPPGVVLDPFAGSGTTLLAAKALGRDAVGIDCSADYVTLTRHRLEHQGAPLFPVTEERLE